MCSLATWVRIYAYCETCIRFGITTSPAIAHMPHAARLFDDMPLKSTRFVVVGVFFAVSLLLSPFRRTCAASYFDPPHFVITNFSANGALPSTTPVVVPLFELSRIHSLHHLTRVCRISSFYCLGRSCFREPGVIIISYRYCLGRPCFRGTWCT